MMHLYASIRSLLVDTLRPVDGAGSTILGVAIIEDGKIVDVDGARSDTSTAYSLTLKCSRGVPGDPEIIFFWLTVLTPCRFLMFRD